jgi:DNA-binding NarL/FixJ family response regulator
LKNCKGHEQSVRILIADDHELVREGVRRFLERQPGWEICGTARTGREAVHQAEKLRPDVVVLDFNLPELNGLEAVGQIKRAVPQTEILIFTGVDVDELIPQLFEAGAKGVVLKSSPADQLIGAIQSVSRHKPFFTDRVSETLFSRFLTPSKKKSRSAKRVFDRLSKREREIIQLLAEGKTNKQVAHMLGIGIRTAETHRAVITRKLHLDSFAALVRYAIRNNIIQA